MNICAPWFYITKAKVANFPAVKVIELMLNLLRYEMSELCYKLLNYKMVHHQFLALTTEVSNVYQVLEYLKNAGFVWDKPQYSYLA